jgi:exo-beta-1,3-glucanase (GH17 family)
MKNLNKMFSVQPVKEYNSNQIGANMMFLNSDGTKAKRGYVVSCNGVNKFCKNKKELSNIKYSDFVDCHYHNYTNGSGMSNESWMNT